MIAEFINPAYLGFILVGVMLFAIFVGFPISFTLIFLGFVDFYYSVGFSSVRRSSSLAVTTLRMRQRPDLSMCIVHSQASSQHTR